jgi:hypothetical protein
MHVRFAKTSCSTCAWNNNLVLAEMECDPILKKKKLEKLNLHVLPSCKMEKSMEVWKAELTTLVVSFFDTTLGVKVGYISFLGGISLLDHDCTQGQGTVSLIWNYLASAGQVANVKSKQFFSVKIWPWVLHVLAILTGLTHKSKPNKDNALTIQQWTLPISDL